MIERESEREQVNKRVSERERERERVKRNPSASVPFARRQALISLPVNGQAVSGLARRSAHP